MLDMSMRACEMDVMNIGVLMIRVGFWGPFYYNYSEEPPRRKIEGQLYCDLSFYV